MNLEDYLDMAYDPNNDWRYKPMEEFVDKINEHDPGLSVIYVHTKRSSDYSHWYVCKVKADGRAKLSENTLTIETEWLIDSPTFESGSCWIEETPKVYKDKILTISRRLIERRNLLEEVTDTTAESVLEAFNKAIIKKVNEYTKLKESFNLCRRIFKVF